MIEFPRLGIALYSWNEVFSAEWSWRTLLGRPAEEPVAVPEWKRLWLARGEADDTLAELLSRADELNDPGQRLAYVHQCHEAYSRRLREIETEA